MKYIKWLLLNVFIFQVLTSCRHLDALSYSTAPKNPIELKILPLEKNDIDKVKNWESEMIDNNICEVYGDKYGYIIYKTNGSLKLKGNTVYKILGSVFLGVPYMLGMPLFITTYNVDIELEIQDCKKGTIAKFYAKGYGSAPCAMYYGYSGRNSGIKVVYDAYNMAYKDIRNQLTKSVVVDINEKLMAKGKLN